MFDLNELIGHWGYLAIFLFIFLGNLGLPVPEEAVLVLAGLLVWEGRLRLVTVFLVGVMSAVAGDNLGYWVGRRYGRLAVERYGQWLFVTPRGFDLAQRYVTRYGALGVFVARFLPGLRFTAGPLAGTAGMPFLRFVVSNVLGAVVYVPLVLAVGQVLGYGVGGYVDRFLRMSGKVEYIVLIAIFICSVLTLGWRGVRARGGTSRPDSSDLERRSAKQEEK